VSGILVAIGSAWGIGFVFPEFFTEKALNRKQNTSRKKS
jgi:hypothetical protein